MTEEKDTTSKQEVQKTEESTPQENSAEEQGVVANAEKNVSQDAATAQDPAKKAENTSTKGKNRSHSQNRRDNQKGKGSKKRSRRGRRGRGDTGEKEFEEEVLEIARVTRVVKGGRRLRFRATVIVGDRKGRVGMSTGKSTEVAAAVHKAVAAAKKNLIKIPIIRGTIPHEVKWKHKGARILLMPAKEGIGIIAGGALRKIADLSGIQNILGKSYGTNNKLVNAQAMMGALQSFRQKKQDESAKNQSPQKNETDTEKTVHKKISTKE